MSLGTFCIPGFLLLTNGGVMKFQSILFKHSPKELLKNEPDFFRDLHLHDIMDIVLSLS